MRHPKHKSLYFDEFKNSWEIVAKKVRSTHCCSAPWCCTPPSCFYRPSGKLYISQFCAKCRGRKWRANNPIKYAYFGLKESARKRDIPFSLKFDEFKVWCEQTGCAAQKGIARLTDHCDRIDDSKGYEISNIQLLSEGENVRKQRQIEQDNKDPF